MAPLRVQEPRPRPLRSSPAHWCRLTAVPAALALSACAGAEGGAQTLTPGKKTLELSVNGVARQAVVHVPTSLPAGGKAPVVLMLHGTSGDGEKFYNISGWVQKAEAEGFVAVFPSSLTYCLYEDANFDGQAQADEFTVTTKWADGKLGGPSQRLCTEAELAKAPAAVAQKVSSMTVLDDVAFLRALVDKLASGIAVDPKRLYVSGFSNGGNMAARLAVEASDLFAAVGVAGGSLNSPGVSPRPMPVIVSLGSLDENALNKTGALEDSSDNLTSFPVSEAATAIPAVGLVVDEFRAALGLSTVSAVYRLDTVNGKAVAHFAHVGAAPAALHFMVIDGATHQYPNGTNHPVVMPDLLWSYFRTATLP